MGTVASARAVVGGISKMILAVYFFDTSLP